MRFAPFAFLILLGGCNIAVEPGPTITEERSVEAGAVEQVRTEIRMGAGELRIEGGSSKLVDAHFRYSENLGKPHVQYSGTGFRGRLTVENPSKSMTSGNVTNEWTLRFGEAVPLDFSIQMGAGEGDLNFSTLPIRNVEINLGAGEMRLNLKGDYKRDVDVRVNGGVGEATIRVPKNMAVVANVKGGIGEINVNGLRKNGSDWVSATAAEGKPTLRLQVRGGIGEVNVIAE